MPAPITRHTVQVQGRQLHLRRQGEGPPVLLLHESPRSSSALLPLMALAPPGLCLLAPDTPGNGHSEPLALHDPTADDYADTLAALLDLLQLPRVAVYGTHTGAAIGMALADRHPQRVAGLVLDGVGVFNAAERAELLGHYLPRFEPRVDGTHLAWLWARVRDQMTFFPWNHRGSGARLWRPLPPAELLHAVAMDFLRAGDAYRQPYIAAFRYQPAAVLPGLQPPTWVAARDDDMLLPHLDRLPPALPRHRLPPRGPAWGAQVWAWLQQAAQGLPPARAVPDSPWPADRLADRWTGPAGAQWRWFGCGGGSGRPLLWLHPSPGAARCLPPALQRLAGQRPVLALDLPGHGDTQLDLADADAALQALADEVRAQGLADAEIVGQGLGVAVAAAVAPMLGQPRRAAPPAPAAARLPTLDVSPRDDGGHLAAAWFHARDEAIWGGWWQRQDGDRHDFGDQIDVPAVHAAAVQVLADTPFGARWRHAWAQG